MLRSESRKFIRYMFNIQKADINSPQACLANQYLSYLTPLQQQDPSQCNFELSAMTLVVLRRILIVTLGCGTFFLWLVL